MPQAIRRNRFLDLVRQEMELNPELSRTEAEQAVMNAAMDSTSPEDLTSENLSPLTTLQEIVDAISRQNPELDLTNVDQVYQAISDASIQDRMTMQFSNLADARQAAQTISELNDPVQQRLIRRYETEPEYNAMVNLETERLLSEQTVEPGDTQARLIARNQALRNMEHQNLQGLIQEQQSQITNSHAVPPDVVGEAHTTPSGNESNSPIYTARPQRMGRSQEMVEHIDRVSQEYFAAGQRLRWMRVNLHTRTVEVENPRTGERFEVTFEYLARFHPNLMRRMERTPDGFITEIPPIVGIDMPGDSAALGIPPWSARVLSGEVVRQYSPVAGGSIRQIDRTTFGHNRTEGMPMNFDELMDLLKHDANGMTDYMVRGEALRPEILHDELQLIILNDPETETLNFSVDSLQFEEGSFTSNAQPNEPQHLTTIATWWSTRQFLNVLGYPIDYYNKCPPELRKTNVDWWVEQQDFKNKVFRVRTKTPTGAGRPITRAFLSSSYTPFDNLFLMSQVEEDVFDSDLVIFSHQLHPTFFRVSFLRPPTAEEAGTQRHRIAGTNQIGKWKVGLIISNSEVGRRNVSVNTYVILYPGEGTIGAGMIFQGRAGENLFRRRHRGSTTEAIRTDLSEAMGKVWEFNDTIDEYMRKAADKVIEDPAGLMESFLARQKFSKYRVKKVLEVMEEAPFNAPMSLFEIAYWVACQKLTAPNYAPRDLGEDEAESLAFKLIKKEVRL